jgi:hypothetical protein
MASQQLKLMNDIYPSIKARASDPYTIVTTKHLLAVLPANIDTPLRRRNP